MTDVIEGRHFSSGGGGNLRNFQVSQDTIYRNCAFELTNHDVNTGARVGVLGVPSGVTIRFEHCYFRGGDGDNCILANPGKGWGTQPHNGRAEFEECWVGHFGSDALYCEMNQATGTATGGIHVNRCYFQNNNVSHVRLNAGSSVRNTTIRNTNNVPIVTNGRHPNGIINSRGLHTFYGYDEGSGPSRVTAENVHITLTDANTNPAPNGSAASAFAVSEQGKNGTNPIWDIRDSEFVGKIFDQSRFNGQNVGSNPSTNAPMGVPMTVQEALDGTSSAQGIPGETAPTPPEEAINLNGKNTVTLRSR